VNWRSGSEKSCRKINDQTSARAAARDREIRHPPVVGVGRANENEERQGEGQVRIPDGR